MWPKDSIKIQYIVSLFLVEEIICKSALLFQGQIQQAKSGDWCAGSFTSHHLCYSSERKFCRMTPLYHYSWFHFVGEMEVPWFHRDGCSWPGHKWQLWKETPPQDLMPSGPEGGEGRGCKGTKGSVLTWADWAVPDRPQLHGEVRKQNSVYSLTEAVNFHLSCLLCEILSG